METMQAAYVESLGPVDAIRYAALAVPTPGPTDVLVAVEATTVNPVDTFVRSGAYATATPFPFVIGRDLAGTVAAVGDGSTYALGERVWCNSLGHDGRQGAFAEYAVVSTDRLYRIPDGVDATAAVAVAHPAATAYLGWFEHAQLRPGETVYVGGAAGNVGRAAVAMAKRAGAYVVASARADEEAVCADAGADVVLDYREPDLASAIREAAPDGVGVFWDTSGRQRLSLAVETCALRGRAVMTAGGMSKQVLPVGAFYMRDLSLHGFVISRASSAQLDAAAQMINDLLSHGLLDVRVADELPLSAAAQAHARMEAGGVRGRLILRP